MQSNISVVEYVIPVLNVNFKKTSNLENVDLYQWFVRPESKPLQ